MWFLYKIIKRIKTFNGSEGGITLIETLIALAILGAIVAAIGSGLATTSKTVFVADERSTIESLAISQMEHLKNSAYINFSDPEHEEYELIATPSRYSVEITATPIDPDTAQPLPEGQDLGLQKITVTAIHEEEAELTFEAYKVER